MPAHNWQRVRSGTFHDFHSAWIAELRRVLNGGLLPREYYVLTEQVAGETGPDVLTLHAPDGDPHDWTPDAESSGGGLAVAEAPPKVALRSEADEALLYALKRKTLVIRHASGDEIVAMIEIVSPGNKLSRAELEQFVHKAQSALKRGIHLLILDLFPPGKSNPQGIHPEIWQAFNPEEFEQPVNKPLTLAAYSAGTLPVAYVEPIAFDQDLPEMPLFLTSQRYINVPLEATYRAAYQGVPERWRRVIEDRAGS